MKLRPHHLLCTQGYEGKGYNSEFVKNMDEIVEILRGSEDVRIDLVYNTDDICEYCPRMLGINICIDNIHVNQIDKKVVKYFMLEKKDYSYREAVWLINSRITNEIMDDICGGCFWYEVSACRNNILSGKYVERSEKRSI